MKAGCKVSATEGLWAAEKNTISSIAKGIMHSVCVWVVVFPTLAPSESQYLAGRELQKCGEPRKEELIGGPQVSA